MSTSPEIHRYQHPSPTSPNSRTRRRRKLPTPPVHREGEGAHMHSPHTPRTSALEPQLDEDSPGRHRGTLSYSDSDRGIGFTVSFDAPQSLSHESSPEKEITVTSRDKNDDESLVSGMFSSGVRSCGSFDRYKSVHNDSARSTASLDTEILLKDSETVMRAIEQRVEKKKLHAQNDYLDDVENNSRHRYSPVAKEDLLLKLENDSDSDTSSTGAIIGDISSHNQSVKHTIHRPEAKKSNKHKPSSIIKDKALNHIGGRTGKMLSNSSADFEIFGVTDESGNESGSVASTSTDYSMSNRSGTSPKLQRKGSAGKGSIANTRVNRTFALRRNKADGSDGETSKTEPPTSARSSRRSVSEKSTPRGSSRTRPSSAKETTRTDASLGQQIVQKSRDNMRTSSKDNNSKDKSLTRKDGGRFSLRNSKSQSVSGMTSDARSRQKSEVTTPRSGRSSGGLSVTGSTPKSSQSSKSSNKAEEYKAWQRRHKYDPRKAVADAKAKEKRARSVGNTPEFTEVTRPRGDTMDSVSSEDSSHIDEITRLSSVVASDLNLMTHKHEMQSYTEVFNFQISVLCCEYVYFMFCFITEQQS